MAGSQVIAPQVARCRLSLQQAAAGKILGQLAKPTYVSNTHSTPSSNAWQDEACILLVVIVRPKEIVEGGCPFGNPQPHYDRTVSAGQL